MLQYHIDRQILYSNIGEQLKIHSTRIAAFVEFSSYFISELCLFILIRRCVRDLLPSPRVCKADSKVRELCLCVLCVKLLGFLLCTRFLTVRYC